MPATVANTTGDPSPGRQKGTQTRIRAISLAVVAALVVGGATGWAAHAVLMPPQPPSAANATSLVTVAMGEVGATIALNAVAQWTPVPAGRNQSAGIVTSIDAPPGTEATAGTVLYRVNTRPVVAAAGAVPAYRDLDIGARGIDVEQLQRMLIDTGLLEGSPNGVFDTATANAVRAWRKTNGLSTETLVAIGDIIYLPALPIRVRMNPDVVSVGGPLGGAETAVDTLGTSPDFQIPLSDGQIPLVPQGTHVNITFEDHSWAATVSSVTTDDAGLSSAQLVTAGADGSTICGDQCAQISVEGQTLLPSTIVTVPTVTGLVVATAAIVSDATGNTALLDAGGIERPVTVVATAKGMSIVEGVDEGFQAQIPAEATQ